MSARKAFTLVELMVAMSIIAVLIGLSVFGISTAQRNLRDNQRRDAVKNIAAALASHYSNTSSYPTASTFANLNTTLTNPVPTTGVTAPRTTTTASGTAYCYAVATDGYILGVLLESGNWFSLSSSATQCSSTYQIAP